MDESARVFDAYIPPQDGMVLVIVRGEIDMAVSKRFGHVVADAVTRSPHIVLDMGAVTFIDSSGLSVLASAITNVKAGGSVTIRDGSQTVRRTLSVSGLDRFLNIES